MNEFKFCSPDDIKEKYEKLIQNIMNMFCEEFQKEIDKTVFDIYHAISENKNAYVDFHVPFEPSLCIGLSNFEKNGIAKIIKENISSNLNYSGWETKDIEICIKNYHNVFYISDIICKVSFRKKEVKEKEI